MSMSIPRIATLLVLVAVAAAPSGCSRGTPTQSAAPVTTGRVVQHVDGAEAHKLVTAGALLLDVRTAGEFADRHVEGARNVPLDDLGRQIESLPRDKPIVVYCASGRRASLAASMLSARGLDVRNLGGIDNWNQ